MSRSAPRNGRDAPPGRPPFGLPARFTLPTALPVVFCFSCRQSTSRRRFPATWQQSQAAFPPSRPTRGRLTNGGKTSDSDSASTRRFLRSMKPHAATRRQLRDDWIGSRASLASRYRPRPKKLAKNVAKLLQLPPKAAMDASHVALSILHKMDYLLTWNCTHLANPVLQKELVDF